MKHPASTPDQCIDRTLHALGHTEPSPSFHPRLLAALEAQAEQPAFSPNPLRRFLTISLAAATLATLLLALILHHPHPSTPTTSHLAPEHQAPPLKPADSQLATQQSPTASPAHSLLATSPRPPQQSPPQPPEITATLTITNDTDQQAIDDLHASSYPAPPLLPTPQERMVRLMLRRGERHELAQLDPSRIAASALQDRASFRDFFDPARPAPDGTLGEAEPMPAQPISVPPQQAPRPQNPQTEPLISGEPK